MAISPDFCSTTTQCPPARVGQSDGDIDDGRGKIANAGALPSTVFRATIKTGSRKLLSYRHFKFKRAGASCDFSGAAAPAMWEQGFGPCPAGPVQQHGGACPHLELAPSAAKSKPGIRNRQRTIILSVLLLHPMKSFTGPAFGTVLWGNKPGYIFHA
jgi:hypothetical protein